MSRIYVCSLPRVPETVRRTGASHVLTLIKNISIAPTPEGIDPDRHLRLDFSDITEPREGEVAPAPDHVERLLAFVQAWDRRAPMVIHCFAGISRSTAGAFIAACALMPHRSEAEIAQYIRDSSDTAMPNSLLVGFADDILHRQGRMISAIEDIGSGIISVEGVPFHIDIT